MLTDREKCIYLIGQLGYKVDEISLKNAADLLEENEFDNAVNFISELEVCNAENNTCAKISLAGNYAALKIKDGNIEEINKLIQKYNMFI